MEEEEEEEEEDKPHQIFKEYVSNAYLWRLSTHPPPIQYAFDDDDLKSYSLLRN